MTSATLNQVLIQYEREPPISVPQKSLPEMVREAKSSLSLGKRNLRTHGELRESTRQRIENAIDELAKFDIDLGYKALAAYNNIELTEKIQGLMRVHSATRFWSYRR